MRCYRCKASCEEHYAESYEVDWYCNAGVSDNDRNEDGNGNLGCSLHYKTIEKAIKENEEAWLKDKEQLAEYYKHYKGDKE